MSKSNSIYFGDFDYIFSNKIINLKFNSSMSFQSIDIYNIKYKGEWYDLNLVRTLLENKMETVQLIGFDEYLPFLEENFNHITNIFNNNNYPITEKKLKFLVKEKLSKMFPHM